MIYYIRSLAKQIRGIVKKKTPNKEGRFVEYLD